MAISLNSPVAMLNLVELVLTIIISGLVAELSCPCNFTQTQYIAAVVYGYLMLTCVICSAIFMATDLDKTLRLVITIAGFCLWLAAAALLLYAGDADCCMHGLAYDRSISAGVLGLANSIAFGIDAFFVYKS